MTEDLQVARSEIQTNWTSSETKIWETVFACAHEFGWSAHYVLNEIPMYWLKHVVMELGEFAKMQNKAMKGEHYARHDELTENQKEMMDRRLAQVNGLDYEEITSEKIFG